METTEPGLQLLRGSSGRSDSEWRNGCYVQVCVQTGTHQTNITERLLPHYLRWVSPIKVHLLELSDDDSVGQNRTDGRADACAQLVSPQFDSSAGGSCWAFQHRPEPDPDVDLQLMISCSDLNGPSEPSCIVGIVRPEPAAKQNNCVVWTVQQGGVRCPRIPFTNSRPLNWTKRWWSLNKKSDSRGFKSVRFNTNWKMS